MQPKKEFKKKILANNNAKWKFIRQDEGNKNPVSVKINGKKTTCERKIAKKYGEHILRNIDSLTNNILRKRI